MPPNSVLLVDISIHAPLTGSDLYGKGGLSTALNFNPRSPYGERPLATSMVTAMWSFQSTLPLRGAT